MNEQINVFKPKVIIGLGNYVSGQYFEEAETNHGKKFEKKTIDSIPDFQFTYIHSIFPSQNTADRWIENNQWNKILDVLERVFDERAF